MKLHLLGTGTSQGVPVIGCTCHTCTSTDSKDKRLRSCAVFEIGDTYILIDTGPDMRQQLLTAKIPRLDAILYTHEHNDHVVGLDDIRPYNFKQQEDLSLFGLHRVMHEIQYRFSYAFGQGYPGAPRAIAHTISGDENIIINDIEITPINIRHGELDILGYRIGDVTFITDGSYIAESELQKLEGLSVLVINALRIKPHPAHFHLEEALNYAHTIGAQRTYLTHISHLMGRQEEWTTVLPPDVFAAYDGLVIEV